MVGQTFYVLRVLLFKPIVFGLYFLGKIAIFNGRQRQSMYEEYAVIYPANGEENGKNYIYVVASVKRVKKRIAKNHIKHGE